ncbi:MAG: hypothetical protein QXZ17_12500 [Nitrososphaerota archaeon]
MKYQIGLIYKWLKSRVLIVEHIKQLSSNKQPRIWEGFISEEEK